MALHEKLDALRIGRLEILLEKQGQTLEQLLQLQVSQPVASA
jgi:hypothetical protein